jgi:hypothetical protein
MTEADDRSTSSRRQPRRPRRVVEDVLIAFHQACDLQDRDIAWKLLVTAEDAMQFDKATKASARREMAERLVSAHHRLWILFHEQP